MVSPSNLSPSEKEDVWDRLDVCPGVVSCEVIHMHNAKVGGWLQKTCGQRKPAVTNFVWRGLHRQAASGLPAGDNSVCLRKAPTSIRAILDSRVSNESNSLL
jgi:hypothetical protein